jgi:hypothetical protein
VDVRFIAYNMNPDNNNNTQHRWRLSAACFVPHPNAPSPSLHLPLSTPPPLYTSPSLHPPPPHVCPQARTALLHPSFLLTALSGGLVMAWFGAWSGVLASALTPPQGHFTSGQAGLLGALVTFAGVCALARVPRSPW